MPEVSSKSGSRRIVVMNGEAPIRPAPAAALGDEGYEVTAATDGMLGLEILSRIRSDPRRADTPVVVLTSKGQDTERETALAGGDDDFLTTPFSTKKLLARIDEILDGG